MKSPDRIRVASLQYWLRPVKNFDEFAQQASDWVRNAADYKSQIVLFPEYFSLQLLSLEKPDAPLPELVRSVSRHLPSAIELFSELAKKHHLTVVAGTFLTQNAEDVVTNECHVFSPQGGHGVQAKIHMTRFEKEDFKVSAPVTPKLMIFETSWGRFAVAICYDVEFPELVRAAALQGAQLILVPSCTDDRQGYYRVRYCAQARTIENQVFVVQSSTVGGLSRFPAACLNYGQAAILTPSDYGFSRDGILAEGAVNQETMFVGELDFRILGESRAEGTVLPLLDSLADVDLRKRVEIVPL